MPTWGHREHHVAYLEERVAELEAALRACIGNAGIPDAGDACRAVIATAKQALDEKS